MYLSICLPTIPTRVYIPSICLPTCTTLDIPVHTLVYTAALVLHSMSAVYSEEALGSKRRKPMGERLS